MSQLPTITLPRPYYRGAPTVLPVPLKPKVPLKTSVPSPKNVYTMKSTRYAPSPRRVEQTFLTDDSITELCKHMSVRDLEAFVSASYKNLMLCNSILDEKIKHELKIKIRDGIIDRLDNMQPGFILDVSNVLDQNVNDPIGKYLKNADWNLVEVPDYPGLYTRRSKVDIMLDILNTE